MEQASTVLLRIVAPHRAYGEYAADAGAVRLRAIHYPKECSPADLGVIPDTRTPDGGEVEALLLGEVAHPPDCLVEARPCGVLAVAGADHMISYLVAVATADSGFDGVTDVAALPLGWRERLRAFFGNELQLTWSDYEAAWALIHQARQGERLARAGMRRPTTGPAWRPDQAVAPAQNGAAPETVRHSRAEYAFSTLPLRFQNYVADYLTPLERVRFFVPRPRMLSTIERSLLRRKRLAEGILILTTEQLLFLEEVLPPDVTEMPHGYLVRGVPVERIVDVALDERSRALVLSWATATDAGQEWLQVEFPATQGAELRELHDRLAAYLPRPRDQRPQRVYAPEAVAPDLRDPAANDLRDAEPTIARLTARRQEQLAPDEVALAQAFIPAWFEYGPGQAQLLLVTAERVLLLAETDPRLDRSYPLAKISSLELRASILGSWLALWMPEPGTVRRVEIAFPSTGFGFQVYYRILRQVLANTPELVREVT
jgi:inorganic pyrophosphatase